MADWRWECFRDDAMEGLPEAARTEAERLATERAERALPDDRGRTCVQRSAAV
ncbi:hypothetical protein GTY65_17145 [Streptomyces sp. SID8379]|uniref:hypothetical protein n=1 Tax=unclassified Streptomyces TaxID=2593676 RepID=UPI000373E49E|nr:MULTISPECIES: hypothetical protein [unclassified Streptomyces]MYW65767.1 hypothetical protein [Streptomyces sp. SID8379]